MDGAGEVSCTMLSACSLVAGIWPAPVGGSVWELAAEYAGCVVGVDVVSTVSGGDVGASGSSPPISGGGVFTFGCAV